MSRRTLGYLTRHSNHFGDVKSAALAVGEAGIAASALTCRPPGHPAFAPPLPAMHCDPKLGVALKEAEKKLVAAQGGGLPKWALPVAAVAVGIGAFMWFRSR